MSSGSLPSRTSLWIKFGLVLLYSGLLSFLLASLVDRPFWLVWISILGLAVAGVTAALSWVHSWFKNSAGRISQFRLLTLFYVMTTVAIYLAAIRWLFLAAQVAFNRTRVGTDELIGFAIITGLLMLVAVFPLLSLAECVVWTAAWAVRRSFVRRTLVAGMRRWDRSASDR